jgi:putative phosphoribosyl transferase
MVFQDRVEAGRALAEKLMHYAKAKPYVIALPRGGVVIAYEVAKALRAPLDVIVARKLGAPGQPELGIGAVAPNGVRVLNPDMIRLMGVSEPELERITGRELREIGRRLERYRDGMPMPDIRGRTVIMVDDGIATGMTALAAIRAIRTQRPERIILAVPIASPEAADMFRKEVDEFIALETPPDFMAVGQGYRIFDQVSDETVIRLMEEAKNLQKRPV